MNSNGDVCLKITVPVCSFRKGFAREYFESEEAPPPSTVYGFLLALVGEEDRHAFIGTKIACALLTQPEFSTVLRTAWRVKSLSTPPGTGENRRPDYQEILTGLELGIWVQSGPLAERLRAAAGNPSEIKRYGGLSLGESRDMVNDILWFPKWLQTKALWLIPDKKGDLPLPVWVDHVGSRETVFQQFLLQDNILKSELPVDDIRWITIDNKEVRV
jgi:CRISPR-associated protein Cas5t